MSDRHPNIVNADPLDWLDLAEATRAAFPGDAARGLSFGARGKQLSVAAGCARLGCSLYELPPGKRGFPFHYHLANEEAIAFSTAPGGPAGGPFEVQRLGTSLTYYDGEAG